MGFLLRIGHAIGLASPVTLSSLFERRRQESFGLRRQAQQARGGCYDGLATGLGLSIVRGFVGRLGGAITVASEPGKGTCVRVRLPLDWLGLAANRGAPVKIETIARLPVPEPHDLNKEIMVKKIA